MATISKIELTEAARHMAERITRGYVPPSLLQACSATMKELADYIERRTITVKRIDSKLHVCNACGQKRPMTVKERVKYLWLGVLPVSV